MSERVREVILEAKGVGFDYGAVNVIDGLDIQVQKEARNLKNPPFAQQVFDASFLPPAAERMAP